MDLSDEEVQFITCDICELPFSGIEPYEQHLKGRKHQKKAKNKTKLPVKSKGADGEDLKPDDSQELHCNVCEVPFSGIIPYAQHMGSQPHKKALRRKKAEAEPETLDDESSDCELSLDDDDLDEVLKEMVPKPYAECTICKKEFSGPETYHQHMKSPSHAKQKRQLRFLVKIRDKFNKSKDPEEHGNEKKFQSAADTKSEELECKECQKTFSGVISFAQHLISKGHVNKLNDIKLLKELKDIEASVSEDDSTSEQIPSSVDDVLTCDICTMAFSGPKSARAHLRSKGHQKALKWKKYISQREKINTEKKNRAHDALPDVSNIGEHSSKTAEARSSNDLQTTKQAGEEFGKDSTDGRNESEVDIKSDPGHKSAKYKDVAHRENDSSVEFDGEASALTLSDSDEECPPYEVGDEQCMQDNLDNKNKSDFPSVDNSEQLNQLLSEGSDEKDTPVTSSDSKKLEPVVDQENNSDKDDDNTRGTESSPSEISHSDEALSLTQSDSDEECPPYDQIAGKFSSGNVDHGALPSAGDQNSKQLYPNLPDSDEKAEKVVPTGDMNLEHTSETQSVQSGDEGITEVAECSNNDDTTSLDSYHDGKRKKTKTAKCRTGMRKIAAGMVKIFDGP